jgi:cyclopropane-fatty-acyl-phospholipid synthase
MAEHFLNSEIVAVSNSGPQRMHIEAEAMRRDLRNARVVTADMNLFETDEQFDRVVSVEMFEHISNWPALLARLHGWLDRRGLLFLHVFNPQSMPYRFDRADKADWIAQHFFTGGVMPSHGLIWELDERFVVETDWRWSGAHYRRTAEHWLANFDAHGAAIGAILREV